MEYGIIYLSIVPVRSDAGDRHEQVSQLLFGEHFTILEKQPSWIFISAAHDSYTGWIDSKQYQQISELEFLALESADPYFVWEAHAELIHLPVSGILPENYSNPSLSRFKLVNASVLPLFSANICGVLNNRFEVNGCVSRYKGYSIDLLNHFIALYLNVPYQWGGRSLYGIDCSGLMQLFSRFAGIRLPRDAKDQAALGIAVNSLAESVSGDLAFFRNEAGRIMHVGLIIGENLIFHASGQVRIDRIDDKGIYNKERAAYTHTLHSLKRIFC